MAEKREPDSNLMNEHKLRAMLAEDMDSPEEAEAMAQVVRQMNRWTAPQPTPLMTAELIEHLLPELSVTDSRLRWGLRRLSECWPVLLIRAQLRVVRREIWAASALVIALGLLVTVLTYSPSAGSAIPLVVLAPVIAAVGVALLYDTEYQHMLEIENTTAASTRMLLLARMTLVFGFDLLLALGASLLLVVIRADVLLWPLVMSWLAPMVFLSGLAFLLAVASRDALAGSVFGLMIWGLHVMLRSIPDPDRWLYALSLPGLSAPENRTLLFLVAAFMVVVALWMAGQHERNIGDEG